jgi:CO/xanthine dehydrogenase Mo-binding subunit
LLSSTGPVDLDTFLEQVRSSSFTISCTAFQDVWTLDLERLPRCCIFVVACCGPFDAKGIAEMANIPMAAAITNAVANAIGARIYDLPPNPNGSTSH